MTNASFQARRVVRRFARRRILVVGDLMLDRYVVGTVTRISPEAPVPVVQVRSERNMPGGAANVARNLRALGARALLHGIVGRDASGAELLALLRRNGVDTRGVARLAGARTTVKTRILADRQQVVRVDWDGPLRLTAPCRLRFCRGLAAAMRRADGVIIADYAKGAVGQAVVDAVLDEARRRRVPVALDPKVNEALAIRGVTLATPNRKEAFALARLPETEPGADPLQDAALRQAADVLLRTWQPALLVITLGAQGMLLARPGQAPRHVPAVAREVFDVSGAGDTVIATLLLALASGADCVQAADLANCAAGVVVGKLGTATCSADELLAYRDSVRLPHPPRPAGRGG